jgi:pimeloyl-ACP methyl ester carboxylesterase
MCACGDDGPNPSAGGGSGGDGGTGAAGGGGQGGDGGGGAAGLSINWTPCPLSSDASSGEGALCASIPVPLRWDEPTGETIDFFVKKIPAAMQPPRGQLWLLNGGPGYSGADFEGAIQAQTVDIYLPDHRGTGRSSRLGCPVQEADDSDGGIGVTDAEMQACADAMIAEWEGKLDGFTITNAARDVGEVIAATSTPDDDILVNGGSYGSIWANRYLQIYPDQADGVVMDAFAVGLALTRDDVYFNQLGEKWMTACAVDPICGAALGPDPFQRMTDAVDGLEAGACPEIAAQGWDRAELHLFWSFFLYTWDLRSLIAPMALRIDRCEPRDVVALQNLRDIFTQPSQPTAAQRYFSMMLLTHIMLSELWEDPAPPASELADIEANATIAHGIVATAAELYPSWPRYPLDDYAGGLAETTTPVLMMRGGYDFIPLAAIQPAIDHFSNGNNLLDVPGAPHGHYAAPQIGGGLSCSAIVRGQFFADPTATLDLSCLDEVAPLPMVPPSDLSDAVFGTPDPYQGDPNAVFATSAGGAAHEELRVSMARRFQAWRASRGL